VIGRLIQRCLDGEGSKLEKLILSKCFPDKLNKKRQELNKLKFLLSEYSKEKIKPKKDLFAHVAARIEQERYREKFIIPPRESKPYLPWAFVGASCCLLLVAVTIKREPEVLNVVPVALESANRAQGLNVDWVRSSGRVKIIKSQNTPILWVTKKKVPTPQSSEILSVEKAFPSGAFPQ
jgi:hypothetical protein